MKIKRNSSRCHRAVFAFANQVHATGAPLQEAAGQVLQVLQKNAVQPHQSKVISASMQLVKLQGLSHSVCAGLGGCTCTGLVALNLVSPVKYTRTQARLKRRCSQTAPFLLSKTCAGKQRLQCQYPVGAPCQAGPTVQGSVVHACATAVSCFFA